MIKLWTLRLVDNPRLSRGRGQSNYIEEKNMNRCRKRKLKEEIYGPNVEVVGVT